MDCGQLAMDHVHDVSLTHWHMATPTARPSSEASSPRVARGSSKPSVRRLQAVTRPRHTSQGLLYSGRTTCSSPPATRLLKWERRSIRRLGLASSPALSP